MIILVNRTRRAEGMNGICGFVYEITTRNEVIIFRLITERAICMREELYLCFIDYWKAFDIDDRQHICTGSETWLMWEHYWMHWYIYYEKKKNTCG